MQMEVQKKLLVVHCVEVVCVERFSLKCRSTESQQESSVHSLSLVGMCTQCRSGGSQVHSVARAGVCSLSLAGMWKRVEPGREE